MIASLSLACCILTHNLAIIQGRPRLKKAIADAYSASFGRQLNPETEVTITTGANEGWTDNLHNVMALN